MLEPSNASIYWFPVLDRTYATKSRGNPDANVNPSYSCCRFEVRAAQAAYTNFKSKNGTRNIATHWTLRSELRAPDSRSGIANSQLHSASTISGPRSHSCAVPIPRDKARRTTG